MPYFDIQENIHLGVDEILSACSENEKLEFKRHLGTVSLFKEAKNLYDQQKMEILIELFKKCNLNELENILKNLKK